jgi:hypothetical protein
MPRGGAGLVFGESSMNGDEDILSDVLDVGGPHPEPPQDADHIRELGVEQLTERHHDGALMSLRRQRCAHRCFLCRGGSFRHGSPRTAITPRLAWTGGAVHTGISSILREVRTKGTPSSATARSAS